MPRFECPVCHGTYLDPEAHGGTYFHVCPPLSGAELAQMDPAIVHGLVPELPANFTRTDIDRVLVVRSIERPGARDENLIPGVNVRIIQTGQVLEERPALPRHDQPPRRRIADL